MTSKLIFGLPITDLSADGQGIGRDAEGRVWFVSDTVPGDVVTVRVQKEKAQHGWATLDNIEQPSDERATPRCEYFGQCGGCEWQHLERTAQSRWKAEILLQTLQRVAGITYPSPLRMVAPEEGYGLRSRLRIQVGPKQSLGFYRKQSHQIIPVQRCPVALPVLQQTWDRLHDILPSFPFPLQEIRLLGNSRDQVVASFHLAKRVKISPKDLKKKWTSWSRGAASQFGSMQGIELWLGDRVVEEWGHTLLEEGTPHVLYRPSAFAQASWTGNRLLVEEVLSCWRQTEAQHLIELYAGSGNLSIPLAAAGASVWALDSNEQALYDGTYATHQHKLQHKLRFDLFDDQLHSLLFYRSQRQIPLHGMVVDPPRRGIPPRIREEICTLSPRSIIYVSCDPGTLARDIQHFLSQGYALSSMVAVDLMPQTAHVEAVVCLAKT